MLTLIDATTTSLEEKQSKFIAYLCRYDDFNTLLERLRREHPKARHFVTAFRAINDFHQIVEHSSDDGEPKGTSGRPSLMVLQGRDIVNTAVIVVRYFGGTKLGTGGLVRAYSDVVNLAVNASHFCEYKEFVEKKISFSYGELRKVEYAITACEIEIVEKLFTENPSFIVRAPKENIAQLLEKLGRTVRSE